MLERERERRELPRRVRVRLEEGPPAERARPHRRILHRGRVAAERIEPLLDEPLMAARLLEVLPVRRRELGIAR